LYASVLILFVFILFALGKLPVGEPRLNAFTIPAVSILIIHLLDTMASQRQWFKVSVGISALLYVGVIGNIYTTFFASITGDMYAKKMHIYQATGVALREAQEKKLPILITPGVAYPFENTRNLPDTTTVPGDWVLKTHPAYRVETAVPVYGISNMTATSEVAKQLPPTVTAVMVGDGKIYKIVNRGSL
jgi:hypothetical protein